MRYLRAILPVLAILPSLGMAGDSCDDGDAPFAPGKVGGEAFPDPADYQMSCDCHWKSGDQIVGIEAWSAKFQLKAIRFKFQNAGWTKAYGDIPDDKPWAHDLKEWAPGDEVQVHITNNKPDDGDPMDGVGRVRITKAGQELFNVGCADSKMQPAEIEGIDSGAGIILGAKVRSGAWVTSLEFKMLKSKIVKTELMELKVVEDLNDWNQNTKGVEKVNIGETYFVNPNEIGGPNLTYTFTNTVKKEDSKRIDDSWTHSVKVGTEFKISNSLSIPAVAKLQWEVGISVEYTYQKMHSEGTTKTETRDLSYSLAAPMNSPLMPQRAAKCEAWALSGTFDSAYTGIVQAILADGSKYNYHSEGTIQSVGWTKSKIQCKDMDIKEVPGGVEVVNGNPIDNQQKRDESIARGLKRGIAFSA